MRPSIQAAYRLPQRPLRASRFPTGFSARAELSARSAIRSVEPHVDAAVVARLARRGARHAFRVDAVIGGRTELPTRPAVVRISAEVRAGSATRYIACHARPFAIGARHTEARSILARSANDWRIGRGLRCGAKTAIRARSRAPVLDVFRRRAAEVDRFQAIRRRGERRWNRAGIRWLRRLRVLHDEDCTKDDRGHDDRRERRKSNGQDRDRARPGGVNGMRVRGRERRSRRRHARIARRRKRPRAWHLGQLARGRERRSERCRRHRLLDAWSGRWSRQRAAGVSLGQRFESGWREPPLRRHGNPGHATTRIEPLSKGRTHFVGRLETIFRPQEERSLRDPRKRRIDPGPVGGHWNGLAAACGGETGNPRLAREWRLSCQCNVHADADSIEVRSTVQDRAIGLLRSHVRERPDQIAGPREWRGVVLRSLGDTEVENLGDRSEGRRFGEEDVAGFDVPVDDPSRVSGRERREHLPKEDRRSFFVERSLPAQHGGERLSLQELHDQVGAGRIVEDEVVHRDDVRVSEPSARFCLAAKPLEGLGISGRRRMESFDRHGPAEGFLVRFVHGTVSALPEETDEPKLSRERSPYPLCTIVSFHRLRIAFSPRDGRRTCSTRGANSPFAGSVARPMSARGHVTVKNDAQKRRLADAKRRLRVPPYEGLEAQAGLPWKVASLKPSIG